LRPHQTKCRLGSTQTVSRWLLLRGWRETNFLRCHVTNCAGLPATTWANCWRTVSNPSAARAHLCEMMTQTLTISSLSSSSTCPQILIALPPRHLLLSQSTMAPPCRHDLSLQSCRRRHQLQMLRRRRHHSTAVHQNSTRNHNPLCPHLCQQPAIRRCQSGNSA